MDFHTRCGEEDISIDDEPEDDDVFFLVRLRLLLNFCGFLVLRFFSGVLLIANI
jgi:hypothetical protein